MFDLDAALRRVIESDGSDLHLKVPSPPLIRPGGLIRRMTAWAMVLLPQPDSPARPKTSPGARAKET